MSFWYLEIDESNVEIIQQHFGKFRQNENYVPIKIGNYIMRSQEFQGFVIKEAKIVSYYLKNCPAHAYPYQISLEELLSYKLWENEPYKRPVDNLPTQYFVPNLIVEMHDVIREYYGLSKTFIKDVDRISIDTEIGSIVYSRSFGQMLYFDEWIELSNLEKPPIDFVLKKGICESLKRSVSKKDSVLDKINKIKEKRKLNDEFLNNLEK